MSTRSVFIFPDRVILGIRSRSRGKLAFFIMSVYLLYEYSGALYL